MAGTLFDEEIESATVPVTPGPDPGTSVADGLLAGEMLGRYRVLDELGAGGMGRVMRAYDPELDREVALKVLRVGDGSTSAGPPRSRLVREAQALAALSHPNVATVFDVDTSGALVFLTMELIEGQTVSQWLQGSRTDTEILHVFAAAGRGLAAAHDAGLVHRDFKPNNVLVGHGRVRVLDFGLAQALAETGPPSENDGWLDGPAMSGTGRFQGGELTRAGAVMGTPAYMAPEQHRAGVTDRRTDQYAFCVALFEALAGARPFAAESLKELGKRKVALDFTAELPARVPGRLRRAILRGLQPRPDDRWPSMDALLEVLSPGTRGMGVWFAAGSAAIIAAAIWASVDRDQCGDVAADWWTPQRASNVRAAFEDATAFAELDAALTEHAEAWVAARVAVCESSASSEVDRRLACLSRQRGTAAALVEVFEDADARTLARAGETVQQLPAAGDCEDLRLLAPSDTKGARAVEDAVARAAAFDIAGQYSKAEAAATEALAGAQAIDHAPLIGLAGFRLGRALGWQGKYAESERALRDAYFVASRAGAHHTAFLAADSLVFIVGEPLGRTADALSWARHAWAELDRLPPDPEAEGMLLHSLGVVHAQAGDPETAREHFERAITLLSDQWGHDDRRLGMPLNNLANALKGCGELQAAHDTFVRSASALEARFGPHHPQVAVALSNVGETLVQLGDAGGAILHLERALAITRGSVGEQNLQVATGEARLGRALLAAGRDDEAIEHLKAGAEKYEELEGYDDVAGPWLELGEAELDAGLHADAFSSLSRAMATLEATADRPEQLAVARFAAAQALWALGDDPDRALSLAKRAADANRSAGEPTDEIDAWLRKRSRTR